MMPHISSKERQTIAIFSALIALLISLPIMLGWTLQNESWQFSGIIFEHFDISGYFARMQQGYAGSWRTSLLTTEPHDSVPFVYSYYVLMGQILRLYENITGQTVTYFDFQIIFHVFRAFLVVIYGVVSYQFVAHFIKAPRWRLFALIIAVWGGGFGWILVLSAGDKPLEFFYLEGFSLPMMLRPHLLLARLSLFSGFLFLFKQIKHDKINYKYLLGASLCWNLVTVNFPLYIGTLYVVIVFWGALVWLKSRHFPKKLILQTSLPVLSTVPLLLYLLFTFLNNPVLKAWQGWDNPDAAENFVASPSPGILLLSFGMLLSLSLGGVMHIVRKPYRSPVDLLPIAWLLAVMAMIYAPIQSQRRLAEGIIIILAILSVQGIRIIIFYIRHRIQTYSRRQRITNAIPLIMLPLLTHASVLFLMIQLLASSNLTAPAFVPMHEVRSAEWVNECLGGSNIIVASEPTSTRLQALLYPNNRILYGHMHETLEADQKGETIHTYLRDEMTHAERDLFYTTYQIDYVIFDSVLDAEELEILPQNSDLNWQKDLTLIHADDTYRIFAVANTPNIPETCQD